MRNGEGSIKEVLKDGASQSPKRWRVVVSYTAHVPDGKGGTKSERRRITRIVRGLKRDAIAMREKIIAEHDDDGNELDAYQKAKRRGETPEDDVVTFSKMIQISKEQRITEGKASMETIEKNQRCLEKFEPYLGPFPMAEISVRLIEEAETKLRQERGISSSTLRNYMKLLKSVFKRAARYKIITENPFEDIELPQRQSVQRRSLSESECNTFVSELDDSEAAELAAIEASEASRRERGLPIDRTTSKGARRRLQGIHNLAYTIAIRIGFYTGMRIGEVLSLVWKNVDLERGRIRVCQTVTRKRNVTKLPKTSSSNRIINIDRVTVEHLRRWKERQTSELAKLGIAVGGDTVVVCNDAGNMINEANYSNWWIRWRKAHGFADLKYHELRHTHATIMLGNGVDVKTVQHRLGHKDSSITLQYYAHAIPENDEAAANVFLLASSKRGFKEHAMTNITDQIDGLLDLLDVSRAASPDPAVSSMPEAA